MKYVQLILLVFLSYYLNAQENRTFNIEWQQPINYGKEKMLRFEGAIYEDFSTPIFHVRIKANNLKNGVELSNLMFENISTEEKSCIDVDKLQDKITYSSDLFYDQGTAYIALNVIPLKIDSKTNSIQKLVSFQVKHTNTPQTTASRRNRVVSHSLMKDGDWLKFGVLTHGVYKISYNEIANAGISNINSPRVYGYGGTTLPEYNSISMPDDMNEIPIHIEKGEDGIFNSGDYLYFYAEGPTTWTYNDDEHIFEHFNHLYSDTIFYFLSCNTGNTKAIEPATSYNSPSNSIDVFMDRAFYENDRINLLKSGKKWYGEEYNAIHETRSFDFSFPNIVTDSLASIQTFAAARCPSNSYIKVSYNNNQIQSVKIPSVNLSSYTKYFVREGTNFNRFNPTNSNISISSHYDQHTQYNAWLDYIRISAVRQLKMTNNQLVFSNIYDLGDINQFTITNTNANYAVLDVTELNNTKSINTSVSQSQIQFNDLSEEVKTYCIFNKNAIPSVNNIRKVANQDLHNLENIEYIILTPKEFKPQAEQIANFHRTHSQLSTQVVTNEEVYNEFSSGTPDITAIKNLMRHLYKYRSNTDTLKYLLLFGDGSYDNKNYGYGNTNKILTYQSQNSIKVSGTYVTDDYFGLLDDTEGAASGYLDIGIGRMVINTSEEADNAVNKIRNYNLSNQSFGNWRSLINFAADNGDGNAHMKDADDIATFVETNYPSFSINKIYLDAYPLVESAGGDIVPEATHDFNTAVNQGTLIMNYTGHGGELGLAHEQLINIQDVLSWHNSDQLAAFITATCEFTRFDDKERTSAGEHVFLNPKGGGIALFTTTRIAYAGPNKVINMAFYRQLFDDNTFRMGDLIRRTKNAIGSTSQNMRIFTLIGDPALSLAIPKEKVKTTYINEEAANEIDTINISPLSKVTIKGVVTNHNDAVLEDFNGIIYPTVYDKPDTLITLCQFECSNPISFMNRKNIIYKGKASVVNGQFEYSFVVPKDISYKNGLGKIAYYADNKVIDAYGHTGKLSISGNSSSNITDKQGPQIELYMNDENFIYGGTTDENPMLLAKLYDENGINTVGNGIGHDITAQLDNNNEQIVLNTFYEADLDQYQSGYIEYPFAKLEEGKHTLHFKAWDVFNNSNESTLEFFVSESSELAIKHIFNYPNPFTTNTSFHFDHNQANQNLDVLIQIFTVTGKLVKTIETSLLTDGFRSTPIPWDGRDDYNDRLARGVYIYKLKVRTETGETATEFEKLVLLK